MADRREYELLFKLNAQLGGSYNSTFKSGSASIASMQKELQNLNKLQGDISSYQRQQAALEALRKQHDNLQAEMKQSGNETAAMKNKLIQKQLAIENATAALNKLDASLRNAGVDTSRLTDESRRLENQYNALRQRQEDLAVSGDDFGDAVTGSIFNIQTALASAGVIAGLKAIYEYLSGAVEASIEFQSAMTGVAKTTDLTDDELAAMSEEIKALSERIPITTTALAGVAEVAGQLGIQKENLLDFATVMSMLSTATTMTAENAATMLAQFANITQMDPSQYKNLASTIVDLGNNFATTEQKITDMAQGIAAAASLAGMSEADMLALSAAVTSLGIETQAGSTAMSKLIADMSLAVETGGTLDALATKVGRSAENIKKLLSGDNANDYFEYFAKTAGMSEKEFRKAWTEAENANETLKIFAQTAGLTTDEFRKAWGEKAISVLERFITGLSDTEKNGKSATLILNDLGITEARMQRMVLSLAGSGDLLNRTIETANRAWEENTALQIEAEKRYATMESRLIMAENAWNNLKITIGDKLTPVLASALEIGVGAIEWLDDMLKGHQTLQEQLEESSKQYENNSIEIRSTGAVALDYIDRLEELERQGLNTKAAQEEYRNILEKLTIIMPSLREQIDLETGSIKNGTEALRENTKEWMNNAMMQAYSDSLQERINAFATMRAEYEMARTELNKAMGEYDILAQKSSADAFATLLGVSRDTLAKYSAADFDAAYQRLIQEGDERKISLYNTLLSKYSPYKLDMSAAQAEVEKQQAEVDNLYDQLKNSADEMVKYAESIEKITGADINITSVLGDFSTALRTTESAAISAASALGVLWGANVSKNGYRNVTDMYMLGIRGYANGLSYVPYDNFPALLHQGERVLTAEEARSYDDDSAGVGRTVIQVQYSPVINGGVSDSILDQLYAHAGIIADMVDERLEERSREARRRKY